jgi:predicted secreted protein
MIIKGSEVILYKNDLEFGCSKDCSLSLQVDLKEITSQTSAFWREYKSNIKTWSMQISGLTGTNGYTFAAISQDWMNGVTLAVSMVFNAGGTQYITFAGNVKIVNVELTGNYRAAGTYSVQLQGTGAITITNTITPPITSANVKTAVYTATGGETSISMGSSVNITELLFVARGASVNAGPFITSGSPLGSNVKYTTGVNPTIQFAPDAPLFEGEFIRVLYN